jgi:hypothetical protein
MLLFNLQFSQETFGLLVDIDGIYRKVSLRVEWRELCSPCRRLDVLPRQSSPTI